MLEWKGESRERVHSGNCTPESQGKFCFFVPRDGRPNRDRPAQGLQTWMETLQSQGGKFLLKETGTQLKGLKRKDKGGIVTWGALVDEVINWCLSRASNKVNNGKEDKYLSPTETRLWHAVIGRDAYTECNSNGSCQKMLGLVACIISWIWGDDNRLKGNIEHLKSKCDSLKPKFLKSKYSLEREGPGRIRTHSHQQSQCGAGNSFDKCPSEALSLVISVSMALKDLCPECPTTGLDEILGTMLRLEPTEGLFCQASRRTDPSCAIKPCSPTCEGSLYHQMEEEMTVREKIPQIHHKAEPTETAGGSAPLGRLKEQEAEKNQMSGDQHRAAKEQNSSGAEDQGGKVSNRTRHNGDQQLVRAGPGLQRQGTTASIAAGTTQPELASAAVRVEQGITREGDPAPPAARPNTEGQSELEVQPAGASNSSSRGDNGAGNIQDIGAAVGGVAVAVMLVASAYGYYRIYIKGTHKRPRVLSLRDKVGIRDDATSEASPERNDQSREGELQED
ncbi:hypothetical protein C922_05701 [Plasmodium inui San Antonio 1]|uniref:Uncharacterized protein n=1 Tax=Plasmodium inui San Antonio 1 TaxID=1237626 RepID=W7AF58_9APIC|nr:hypothetical protein C922_05701 [Plasmodium inui San Antonio 1]EUD63916.1 hypothetical protein C922_05701 [Plasmodium inui San Antonio 1]